MQRTCTISKMPALVCCELLLSRTRCSEQSKQATLPQTDNRAVSQLLSALCSRKTGWSMDVIELTKPRVPTPKFLLFLGCCHSEAEEQKGILN